MKRLFIPLKTEPYTWFEQKLKKYELRNQKGQYNKNQLIKGRAVELRRGYSTNDKLFGTISEVYFFNDIEDLLN